MTAATTADDIKLADVRDAAVHVITTLNGQLREQSATARAAETSAFDALGQLERAITTLEIEGKRQAAREAERKAVAAQKVATDKQRQAETDRQRHIRSLELESQRQRRLKQAQEASKHAAAQK